MYDPRQANRVCPTDKESLMDSHTSRKAQEDLVDRLDISGWDLIVGDAFVRGMRDIGYKSSSYAMAELIDNSIQAGATKVDVIFGFDRGAKPTKIAIVDNGWGMTPRMVRASLIWGAGTRLDSREGFGKYGYGLPSASVSQCFRVEVYSKDEDGTWTRAYLDVDEISRGEWTNNHRISSPSEVAAEPPGFVLDALKDQKRGLPESGTVVVWDKLDPDRIEYKRREEFRNALLTNLGVIYRNYLTDMPITVDGVDVQPCDPLFLTEGFRYYDLDADRAIGLPPAVMDVSDRETKQPVGKLRIRYSRLPATFFRKPEFKANNKPGRGGTNARLEIADPHNGIIFLRNGRQIDVVKPPRSIAAINATTDRFWAVEVDFDATLDGEFSITTAKQQVTPSPRIWDILKDKAKIFEAIATMRREYEKDARTVADRAETVKKKASVEAIENAEKFRTTKPPKDTPSRRKEAKENLDDEVRKRAQNSGLPPASVERELEAQQEGNPRAVETEDLPGAPFFRCLQRGGQRVLLINIAHAFYTDLYQGQGSTPRLRAALEILLWTLGEAEVDSEPESERRRFYERERPSVWSPYLSDALTSLRSIAVVTNESEDPAAA
jgi:Histidine kinase-, DNA gyrase B-, and HSP90-like ATPase